MSSNEFLYPEKLSSSPEIIENLFDFEAFFISIKECVSFDSNDIILEHYLLAYEQLYNFFVLLGGAFSFVAADVKSKIKILQEFQKSEEERSEVPKNFSTVQTMVLYEKEMNLLSNPKYVSGSRTLLRLHRGLDFIRKFLDEIYKTENNTKLTGPARQVYDSTLAEHHTWVVRNAARVAMQFLPTRIELLQKISENNEEKLSQILDIFPEAIESANNVYYIVQELYNINNILNLP